MSSALDSYHTFSLNTCNESLNCLCEVSSFCLRYGKDFVMSSFMLSVPCWRADCAEFVAHQLVHIKQNSQIIVFLTLRNLSEKK